MIGSNRTGGIRELSDPRRASILATPVDRVMVKRRVHDEQVSSYSMSVHRRPSSNRVDTPTVDMRLDRNIDPGEAELLGVQSDYRSFVSKLRPRSFASVVSEANDRRGQAFVPHLLAALFGQMVARNEHEAFVDSAADLHHTLRRRVYELLGRSTWRRIARSPDFRTPILKSGIRNRWLAGELALNANTIYRQGHDVLSSVLPYIDWIMDDLDTIEIPGQQLFNTRSINLIPSSVHPTRAYGYGSIHIGPSKTEWVYSEHSDSLTKDRMSELFQGENSLKLNVVGHLNRRSPKLILAADGVNVSDVHIPWDSVHRTLAGFTVSGGGKKHLVSPIIGRHILTADESSVRRGIFDRMVKTGDLLSQMKERGTTGFGDDEVDIYNTEQFKWIGGRRMSASDDDIVAGIFPHPLLRLAALKYRDAELSADLKQKLGALVACTLPLVPK